MPTENELKYLLNLNSQKTFSKAADECYFIKQGYLHSKKGMTLRVREINDMDGNALKRQLTYKQKISSRLIEIEKKISQRDFEDLWEITSNRLEKIRYHLVVKKKKKYLWEVDFFLHDGKPYIALAEHEMPEDQMEPDFIPDLICKNLVFAVPANDTRFSSKKLADVPYAKTLNNSLGASKNV